MPFSVSSDLHRQHPFAVPSAARARIPVLVGDTLSAETRITRICDLLAKAVTTDWAKQVTSMPRVPVSLSAPTMTSDADRIIGYLHLVGSATSESIQQPLGLSKMRVYRAIQPLLLAGRITSRGQSRQTTYSLSPREASKAQLN